MLSPFIPAASNPSAKPADQTGIHKAEAAAPADGTSFHELLARKTNAPTAHSQSQVHAAAHAKSQAQAHHNANANDHAEAHPNARADARDTSPDGPSATATAARDTAEKPVDHAVNRRVAKPAAKSNSSASGAKTGAALAADQTDSAPVLDEAVNSSADAPADAKATDTAATEDSALPPQPALAEPLQAVGLPAVPLAPVVPLTVGLPSAGTPAPAPSAESADATAAAPELTMAEVNAQTLTAKAGSSPGIAAAKARANSAATAANPATSAVNPADANAQKAQTTAATGRAFAATADDATATEASVAGANSASVGTTSATTDATTAAAGQADARQGANAYGLAAQIADTAKAGNPTAQDLAVGKIKNSNQGADSKEDKKSSLSDGIRRAYELPIMSTTAPVFQAPTASVQTLGPVNPNSPVAPTVASTAVRMVEKVSEVADHLASHPAEQVTVRIDLDATHRVDVHVSMRGGQVHADFRSDSADMRAALASAWKEFSQGREGSDRRWAEPAFAPMAAPAAASSFTANAQSAEGSPSFGPGQDSANRQAAEREAMTQGMGKPSRPSVTAPAPATADVKTPIVRSENSQHLSVLA